ncbi:ribonuclease III [Oceanicella sp. SM1341]|uniref:ribonuclease III n=1 Tax=Oceanicella sp. SM1341 TaxID=1548889 RepID=UPI000E53C48A|nr:ribonuclease III [Oceanicella sp. SM1341]
MAARAEVLARVEARIGHVFARIALLDEALTHASFSTAVRPDNQRLEFLGDRVLGLVIAEALLEQDPGAAEGVLAPRLNALVRKETCAEVAGALDLGAAIVMGRSEMLSGGRRKQAILGDAMESVIAAVYLDAGLDVARAFILRAWAGRIETAEARAADAKSALQEWAQGRGQVPPEYCEIGRSGPPHAPVFTIEVRLASGERAVAQARSKRAAQQSAASALLKSLETGDE